VGLQIRLTEDKGLGETDLSLEGDN
jgi:hypothetical protein